MLYKDEDNVSCIVFRQDLFEKRNKGNSIIDFPIDYTVIDIETTGLDSNYDEILELSAIKYRNNTKISTFSTLIKPVHEIDSFITELTGITNDMVKNAPSIFEGLPEYLDFLENDILIGHNVNFDINFIHDYAFLIHKVFSNDYIDTMRISRKLLPSLPNHKLKTIKKFFSIDSNTSHRGIPDCSATQLCYSHLKQLALEQFQTKEIFIQQFHQYKKHKNFSVNSLSANTSSFNEEHLLYQKYCVFTGTLEKLPRKDAAQLVLNIGGFCEDNVTKKTNFLILGNNDYCKSIKDGKSNKQKKAESLKLKGQDIEIISESTFYELMEM